MSIHGDDCGNLRACIAVVRMLCYLRRHPRRESRPIMISPALAEGPHAVNRA